MHIQYKSTGEGHSINTVLQRYLLDSLHRLHCLGVAVLQCMNSAIFPVSFPSYQRCSKHDFAVEMWIAGSRDHEEGHLVLLDCQSPCYFPAYSFQATSQIQLLVEWKWWSSFHHAQYSSHLRKLALTEAFHGWFKPEVFCDQLFLASMQIIRRKERLKTECL